MTSNILVYQNRTLNHRGWSFLPKQWAAVRTYLELKIEPLYRVQKSAIVIGATRLRHVSDTVAIRVVKWIVKIAIIANFDWEEIAISQIAQFDFEKGSQISP